MENDSCRNCQYWKDIFICDDQLEIYRKAEGIGVCKRIHFKGNKAESVKYLEQSGSKINAFTFIDNHYKEIDTTITAGIITKPDFGCSLFEEEDMTRLLKTV